MAGDTSCRQLIFENITLVTAVALYRFVCIPKRKRRGFTVVETNGFPLGCRMTRSAFLSVAAGMHVLNLVAVDTEPRQVLVAFANMADRALNVAVCALKREFGLGMIERFLLSPRLLGMTCRAL